MKSPNLFLAITRATLLAAASSSVAYAGNGSWVTDGNSDWSLPANWSRGDLADVADGSGATASFTNDITGDRTVNLDSIRTVGNITFGDAAPGTAGSWTLSGANLALAGGTPTVTVDGL